MYTIKQVISNGYLGSFGFIVGNVLCYRVFYRHGHQDTASHCPLAVARYLSFLFWFHFRKSLSSCSNHSMDQTHSQLRYSVLCCRLLFRHGTGSHCYWERHRQKGPKGHWHWHWHWQTPDRAQHLSFSFWFHRKVQSRWSMNPIHQTHSLRIKRLLYHRKIWREMIFKHIVCTHSFTWFWCHCPPDNTPPSLWSSVVSNEDELDNVAGACDAVWQGGATALLQQGCPITVHDFQVVIETGGMELNVKCSKL